MAKLCTDAGHGGGDSGAAWHNVLEKELNLDYTLALNEELKRRGHTVYTTRKSDAHVPPLKTRCLLVNEHHRQNAPKFDVIVSIHCNVAAFKDQQTGQYRANQSVRGFYAIYSEESAKSTALAKSIAEQCKAAGITVNHGGILSTIELRRALAWIHQTLPTATLLELGFMTNPEELDLLQQSSYRDKMVSTIANGIEGFVQ
ncbi:MAG: N-acetylmuramoyl-L-alanine amidase [bacterium]